MNSKLQSDDIIDIYTKGGKKHQGKYRHLPCGYIGLSDKNLAILRENVEKIILAKRR